MNILRNDRKVFLGARLTKAITIFTNARVVLPDRITPPSVLVIEDGRIASISENPPVGVKANIIDAKMNYLMPGFIDIHCHGDGANDFFRDVNVVAKSHLKKGTTGVLATLGYNDMQPGNLDGQVEKLWEARDEFARQTVLGVHLEGPYVNSKYGALVRPGSLNLPVPTEYQAVLNRCSEVVRLWTLAPELRGSEEFINSVAAKGIIMAAGHTEVDAELLGRLVPKGLRVATHWSNATGVPPPRFRGTRSAGIDEFALMTNAMTAEVICDAAGYHVPPVMLNLLYRVKGADRIIIISDAYWSVDDKNSGREDCDVIITADGDLCGSKLCMAQSARNFMKFTGCSFPELSRMTALNPARLFGWSDDLGSLEAGKIANLVMTDDAMNVHGVWLAGSQVVRE